jgi:hypothetical protein
MTGSVWVGYWVAHGAFWMLMTFAFYELGGRKVAVFLALWFLGYIGTGSLQAGAQLFLSYVAVLDIALVLFVFKGDVRLS